jgi:hypothetical protein
VLHAATVLVGDKLGLYKAIADGEPITAEELAERTGTDERYVQEWLSAQAASSYVEYDPAADRFRSRSGAPRNRYSTTSLPRRTGGSTPGTTTTGSPHSPSPSPSGFGAYEKTAPPSPQRPT